MTRRTQYIVGGSVAACVVALGAWVRSPATAPEFGYSELGVFPPAGVQLAPGHVPVQLHELTDQHAGPVNEANERDEDWLTRNASRWNEPGPNPIMPVILPGELDQPVVSRKKKDKDGVLSMDKVMDDREKTLRGEVEEDSGDWGWLAEGVREREQAERVETDRRRESATVRSWSESQLPSESSTSGGDSESSTRRRFNWQNVETE